MANKFRAKLLYGRTGVFNGAIGIGVESPISGLHISGSDLRVDNGNAHFSNRPIVSGNSQVALLSDITGQIDLSAYYLSSNPSGFITESYTGYAAFSHNHTISNISGLQSVLDSKQPSGTAIKTIAFFTALNNEPPATNFATLDTRNSHPVLDFDTTTQETAMFTSVIPQGVSLLSGVNVIAQWAASTATTGTIGWDVAFERIASNGIDIDVDNFGTPRTITAITVPSTAGITLTSSCSFTQAQLPSGLTNGDMYRLRIRRDVASDSASGDAELLGVEVRLV
jgi:hypothetical protein